MGDSINLYQESASKKKKRKDPFDKALFGMLFLLVLVCAGYGGLFTYNQSIKNETTNVKDETQQMRASLDEEMMIETNDVYLRLEAMQNSGGRAEDILKQLGVLEQVVVPDAVIETYTFTTEERGMQLTVVADFLDGISRQITAFRDSEQFSSVEVISLKLEEERGLVAEVHVTLGS